MTEIKMRNSKRNKVRGGKESIGSAIVQIINAMPKETKRKDRR
jgi:hypothetical protein